MLEQPSVSPQQRPGAPGTTAPTGRAPTRVSHLRPPTLTAAPRGSVRSHPFPPPPLPIPTDGAPSPHPAPYGRFGVPARHGTGMGGEGGGGGSARAPKAPRAVRSGRHPGVGTKEPTLRDPHVPPPLPPRIPPRPPRAPQPPTPGRGGGGGRFGTETPPGWGAGGLRRAHPPPPQRRSSERSARPRRPPVRPPGTPIPHRSGCSPRGRAGRALSAERWEATASARAGKVSPGGGGGGGPRRWERRTRRCARERFCNAAPMGTFHATPQPSQSSPEARPGAAGGLGWGGVEWGGMGWNGIGGDRVG